MVYDMNSVDRIREAMKRKRITQAQLGRELGVSQAAIFSVLNKGSPQYETIVRYALALDVDPDWIQFGDDDKAPDWAHSMGFLIKDAKQPNASQGSGKPLDVVLRVKAGDGNVAPLEQLNRQPCSIPDDWKLVEVEGMSAYPVVYPGQLAAIDMSRATRIPIDDAAMIDLHDNICVVETWDERAYIKRFCHAPGAIGGFMLASVDAGRSSPFVDPADISAIIPVVAVLFQDPRKSRQKRWHGKTVVAETPNGLFWDKS